MPLLDLISFIFLGATFLSVWVKRDPKIWGSLLGLSLTLGAVAGRLDFLGCMIIATLLGLWIFYKKKSSAVLWILIVILSLCIKMRILPGFNALRITSKFALGLEGSLIGLFPLAFAIPLAKSTKDWSSTLKGAATGCIGITILATIATFTGATKWHLALPSFAGVRILSNFFLLASQKKLFIEGSYKKASIHSLKTALSENG